MQQDMINNVMKYEAGELTVPEIVGMFTTLIETGELWVLPDSYLNDAATLIFTGAIKPNPSKEAMN